MSQPPLPPAGLTEREAQLRLKQEGYNELPSDQGRSFLKIIIEVFREPMFAMLMAAGVIYFIIGDWHEAAFLSAFAILSVTITIVQELRSENVLKALKDLTSPRALVIRDGARKRIPGRDVVRGDLVFLTEGDRVPADGRLVDGSDVMADESLLTGESVAVRKKPDTRSDTPFNKPGGDDLPDVYSGTLIVRGYGTAIITHTGIHSQIGEIGRALQSIDTETQNLQKEIGQIVRIFGLSCFGLSTVAIVAYGLLRGSWLEAVLGGIALGMSLLPQEFPMVLTVFMAMGAWRISQVRVLTRRASAIETLGSATVLCTDKTGTLTENRMSVVAIDADGGPDFAERVLRIAALASKSETFEPMDAAIFLSAQEKGVALPDAAFVHHYGLQPELLAVTQIWRISDQSLLIASKGAPEAIARLCRFNAQDQEALSHRIRMLAERGIRVLGVAEAQMADDGTAFPQSPLAFPFQFVGLVGFADPLRTSARAAVAECHAAGIRVVMITGDYPETANAIAVEAGIAKTNLQNAAMSTILTGHQIAAMDEAELAEKCRMVTVFARIMPNQKLRIVNALKSLGEVVAMTGDGVNDAPALKAAHIGIAMGGRGTDVAREASSIVLLDDEFSAIVHTIRLGRRIYDNLQKAMTYIIAVHVPIAGMAMLPIFFGFPLILTPLLIALMEMVIDPVCSVVLEAETEESTVMSRPPRNPHSPLLPPRMAAWGAFQGIMALVATAGVFFFTLHLHMTEEVSRSLAFLCLMASNFALIFANRSYRASIADVFRRDNPLLLVSLMAVPAFLSILFVVKDLRVIFGFAPLGLNQLLTALLPAVLLLLVLGATKKLWDRY